MAKIIREVKATRVDAVDNRAREKAEAALRERIAAILKKEQARVSDAIARGERPNASAPTALRQQIEIELTNTARDEMLRVGSEIGVEYDTTAVDQAAREWAQRYAYDLIRDIDNRSRDIVSNAISKYTEAQGMTRGDLNALLLQAYDPVRADRIAVTETTRAYGQAQEIYQEMLRADGVEMERVWNSDNDSLVCEICRSLNRTAENERGVFYSDFTKQEYARPPAHVNCRCGTGLRLKR